MLFIKKKIDKNNLPKHIAFIMDGNGRWARHRGLPRNFGHKVGMDSILEVVKECHNLGIKVASFYAFSTENWNRDKAEVDEIFRLMLEGIKARGEEFVSNNLKLRIMGDISRLSDELRGEIERLMSATSDNTGLVVNIGINYGSRAEIVRAVNNIIADGLKEVDEQTISNYLYTSNLPDPDFVVRTSGEQRLSNFMLYQNAYAELYFPKVYWPAFRRKELKKAILVYQSRDRRYGAIKKK